MYVFLLALGLRLYACINIPIINPDGVYYINQAKAIYHGQWGLVRHCGLSFVSNYPFFIAGAYGIFHDWIIAARSVSLVFGFAALLPLYFLLKRFFTTTISALCILIFALIPVLVSRSGDVVRGPVFWFFITLGLYFFVSQIGTTKRTYLLFSAVSFVMATWARIESILFIVVSCFYILFIEKEERLERLAVFLLPVFLLIVFAISWALISGASVGKMYRANEILSKFSETVGQYQGLRESLRELAASHHDRILRHFLPKARNLLWLIALGYVVKYTVAAFFYPFFLVFIIGLGGIVKRIKNDRRVWYFSLLVVSGLSLLFINVLHEWIIQYRFLAIVLFPSCIFLGFGLERILHFLKERCGQKESIALIVVCSLILVSGLPKNLKARETDKAIFRQIGELIAQRQGNLKVIKVAGVSSKVHRWVSFYANLHYPGVFCPQGVGIAGNNYEQFVQYLRKNGIRYFLWEKDQWPVGRFDFIHADYQRDFTELGRWSHPDTEEVILFEVMDVSAQT
jgi:4-amino-4-deoxy-L-arabinose transferase-like glycosyltransferase